MLELSDYNMSRLKQTENKRLLEKVYPFLLSDEDIISVYKNSKNLVVFTEKRIMTINMKGMFGKKNDITTFPYSKVCFFSCSSDGTKGGSIALNFGQTESIVFEFTGNSDVVELGKIISSFALK